MGRQRYRAARRHSQARLPLVRAAAVHQARDVGRWRVAASLPDVWRAGLYGRDRRRPVAAAPQAQAATQTRKGDTMTAPFVKGSDTSREAAQSLPEPALARLEAVVFASIVSFGGFGCTDDELERLTELSHQTVSARRRGLVQKGRIVDSGLRRQTRSGRKAT